MRPAEAPGGFLKMQPALFWPKRLAGAPFFVTDTNPLENFRERLGGKSSFTASIISSGANEVCRYSKEI